MHKYLFELKNEAIFLISNTVKPILKSLSLINSTYFKTNYFVKHF
jgi:hypothetical protein